MNRLGVITVLCCGLLALPGCRQNGAAPGSTAAQDAVVVREGERGPVKMRVSVNRHNISIADEIVLSIAIRAPEQVDIDMPQFGEQLDDFTIRDFRNWAPAPDEGVMLHRQEYKLDIYLSGTYEIPSLSATFTDRRDESKPIEGVVTTAPIEITVQSLIIGEFDPAAYRDIKGTVDLPPESSWAWAWWTTGGTVFVLAALWLVRRHRRRPQAAAAVVPAHDWALDQLRELRRAADESRYGVHELYFRLSGIMREYIERRFALMAPERTTEEFLVEMQGAAMFSPEHKQVLRDFLRAADLVKFALHEPGAEETETAFATAGDFVRQTAGAAQHTATGAAA